MKYSANIIIVCAPAGLLVTLATILFSHLELVQTGSSL
jgi:hypothetical protein